MPRAPRKCPRLGCEERITTTTYCPTHTQHHWTSNASRHRTTTAAHRAQRLRILKRDANTCQLQYPGRCIGYATEMDHRRNVAAGGSDDDTNMQASCRPCHARKSSVEGTRARHPKPGDHTKP